MQYQIIYGNDRLEAQSEAERDAYVNVLKDLDVDYTCEERYLVAMVKFQNSDKVYTYFTKDVLPEFSYAIVQASEWIAGEERMCYKVVSVIRCTMRTKSDLEKVCPLNHYKWIQGTVSWSK